MSFGRGWIQVQVLTLPPPGFLTLRKLFKLQMPVSPFRK
jgi:hypothetical protein